MQHISTPQFSLFKDCLARRLLSQDASNTQGTGDSLDDFITYLALETFPLLPLPLQHATYESRSQALPPQPTTTVASPAFIDTLTSYSFAQDPDDALDFLQKSIADFIEEACIPPPVWSSTRTSECEICEREVPLTYHHLIPRSSHAKVLKKKWHPESLLGSVAWLCRPCHSAVHKVASNEDLARYFYTVDLLLQREDIQKWQNYAAKQRFGVKRG